MPRQKVFLSCAPHASTGRANGRARRPARGNVAARAAQDDGPAGDDPRHRVVAARLDLAIVDQEEVGDAAEPLERLVVAIGDRLLGEVARGHHQGPVQLARAAGGGAACTAASGRPAGCAAPPRPRDRPARGARTSTIGRSTEVSSRALRLRHVGDLRAAARSRTITANGFSSRRLRSRRRRTAARRGRVAGQVEPAEPLDARRCGPARCGGGGADRVRGTSARSPCDDEQAQRAGRTRARVRLGVEAAVGDRVVLALTVRAHGERRHRRGRAIVGNVAGDREARPAVGAVGERIAVAPIVRVEDLARHSGQVARSGGMETRRP